MDKEKETNTPPARNALDNTVCDLTYFELKNAIYLLEVMHKTVKRLGLDLEISKEAKANLKKDFAFTSNAIYNLGQAERAYKTCIKCAGIVENELDQRINPKNFDLGQADAFDLLAVELIYLHLTNGNETNRKKIHNYLKKFKWDEDFTQAFANLQRTANGLLRDFKARNPN